MATTQTRTATQTSTLVKVVYVTRKVQADLFQLAETYGQMSEEYAQKLIHDLRIYLDEEVLEQITFLWTRPGTNQVVGAYTYKVLSGGVGLVDDRSGGIRYDPTLQASVFGVRITHNARWYGLTQAEQDEVESDMMLPWGTGGALDYSRGRWQSERTYSKDGYGLARERFIG